MASPFPWETYQESAGLKTPDGPWSDFAPKTPSVPPTTRQAKDIGDSIIAGLQSSATGLLVRGKLPDVQLPEDAPWYHRIASAVASTFNPGDLAMSVVGAVGGAAALGAAGGAVAGPPGAATGVVVGGGAGAVAVPMAIRDGLIAAYNSNQAASWQGVWDITKASIIGGAKGVVIGGATMGAGRVVGGALGRTVSAAGPVVPLIESRLAIETAMLGSEVATMTTTAAALEGHMPKWQDFMDNAILLGGVKAAVGIAKGMRNTYAETGLTPEQVAADAQRNPAIRTELEKGEVPKAYVELAFEQRVKAALDGSDAKKLTEALTANAAGKVEKPKGDLVRYEYITGEPEVKAVIRAVAELDRERVELQRRGTVPLESSMADARALVASGELARQKIGEADAPHEAAARAILTRDAAVRAKRLTDALADTPVAQRSIEQRLEAQAAVEQVALFYGELAGGVAEAARTLRMMRELKRNPELLGEAELMLEAYNKSGKNIGELASLIRTMDDPNQMIKFANDLNKATTFEKVLEVFRANIFSGFRTHEANLMGNLTKWVIDIPESALAATIFAGQKALAKDPLSMAQYKARAFAPLIGMQLGGKDAVVAAWNVFRMKEEHLEKVETSRLANVGVVGAYTGTVFRGLQAADMLLRIPGERARAYTLAVDRVVKEGIHPETPEGQARIKMYADQPTLGLIEKEAVKINAEIYKAGAEAVFSQRLGPRMEKVQQAIAGSWGQYVFPAFRTPVNLVSYVTQHFPGLNFLSARWREDFAAGGERQAQALAKISVGAALAGLAYTLKENGLLTGGGLFEQDEKEVKEGAGVPKYSLKVGNEYYSIERMEPVAKLFMLATDLADLWKALPDAKDKAKAMAMSILAFANATISTTYLSGMAKAMKAVTEPILAANQFFESYASAVVPKLIGQTVETLDPYKREVDGALDAIQSQIPFLREKLMPRRSIWGEKLPNEKWLAIAPIAVTKASEEKVKTEAVRLHLAIADAPKFMLERGPFKAKERKLDMTAEEIDVMREVSGKFALEELTRIVNQPGWERIPDFAQARIYQEMFKKARMKGAFEALPPDDPRRMILRQAFVDKILDQVQEAESR